jgi:uncharacterized protein YndB with AHSA1/START domain
MTAAAENSQAEEPIAGVNRDAPVVGRDEIEVGAPPELVWRVLTGFEDWPTWNPDVKSVSMQGEFAKGSVFRWKAGPGTIESTIRRVEPPRLIAWTGKTLGIRATHFWWLEPKGEGTLIRTEESFEGVVPRLLRRQSQRALDGGLENTLRHLKAEAERIFRGGQGRQ